MAKQGLRVALLGATGSVGEEIREVLEERRFPVGELCAFASEGSLGQTLEFRGEDVEVEFLQAEAVTACDLVLCAAPGALEPLLPALRAAGTRVVDVSGALELDPAVPLWLADGEGSEGAPPSRLVAVPRGIVAGLALALAPLAREAGPVRVGVVTLESASGSGRRGVAELLDQTTELLNTMSGEAAESLLFPRSLAFDCLPLVGALVEGGETDEEQRLRHVLRRLLGLPGLPVDTTRVRVPTFSGSAACVHLLLSREVPAARALELWEKAPGLRVLPPELLPTPRAQSRQDTVAIGRVRLGPDGGLAFVIAQDDLRRGAALGAVRAAEALSLA